MPVKSFRIGTFNTYNLMLPGVAIYQDIRYTEHQYQKKKAWIGEQLSRMKADIVGFQEVFHRQALEEVLTIREDVQFPHVIMSSRRGEGPAVALASRFPVMDYQIYETFPQESVLEMDGVQLPLTHFSRPVLAAQFQFQEGLEFTVYVVHLKSKRLVLPEGADRQDPIERAKGQARALIVRAAEATALRAILLQRLRDCRYPVIVVGDINDSGLAVTSRILTGEAPDLHVPHERKLEIWDTLLYPVKDIQARRSYGDFYFTHIHTGHYESLDHIMVSQEFVAENPYAVGRVSYVSVFNDHLIDESLTREVVAPWQSDHGQVVANIVLSPPTSS